MIFHEILLEGQVEEEDEMGGVNCAHVDDEITRNKILVGKKLKEGSHHERRTRKWKDDTKMYLK